MKKLALLAFCAAVFAAFPAVGAEKAEKSFFTRWGELADHDMLLVFDAVDRTVQNGLAENQEDPFGGKSPQEVAAAIDAAEKSPRGGEDIAKAYGEIEKSLNFAELRQVLNALGEEEGDFIEKLRKGYWVFGREISAKMNAALMREALTLDRDKLPEAMAVLVSVPYIEGETWRTEAHTLADNLAYVKEHYADNLARNLAMLNNQPADQRDKIVNTFLARATEHLAEEERYSPLAEYENLNSRLEWMTDFAAAQLRAKSEGKPLFVLFTGSDWCPYCILLEKEILSQPEFKHYAAVNLIPVVVDFPRASSLTKEQKKANEELRDNYGVRGYPTILIMNADGEVIDDMGYERVSPAEYVEKIKTIVKKAAK